MSGRAYGRLFLGLTAAGAVWLAWSHGPAAQEAAAQENRDGTHRYVGVAGCAAAACHGGNGPRGAKGSEYSTWAGYDRHPNAFAVLYEERSDRMARALKRDSKAKATTTEECLKCHATNEGHTQGQGDRFVLADGVGCESCHGPAGDWVTTHYLPGFRDRPAAEKERLGLRNIKDLTARARLCTECHVGSGDRDVNHDLIAAGHPRLNFEFASFHAIYPKHWPQGPELQRYPDLHARLWEIGQVVTAKASLELLATRASGKDRPWPEFAEYACYACHKDLQVDNPSQKAGFPRRDPGNFPWGTWYLSMAEVYADQPGGPGKGWTKQISDLRKAMQQPGPDRNAVAQQSEEAAKELGRWTGRVAGGRVLDADQMRALMRSFAAQGAARAEKLDWDQAAQLYLALAAFNQALSDPPAARAPATEPLWAMRGWLQGAFPKGYNSPKLFDEKAKADLRLQLRKVQQSLAP